MALALTQDKYLAIGKKKQADLVTALVAADMLTLAGTQIDLQARPINEDNAADLGKGVYATNVYPSHIEASGSWNGRVTAEALAFLSGYAIGAVSKSSSGDGFKYTMTAPDLETDGLDLPVTTIATKTGAVNNKALIGMACEEFGIQLQSGPGRDNAQFTSSWVGTGQYDNPCIVVSWRNWRAMPATLTWPQSPFVVQRASARSLELGSRMSSEPSPSKSAMAAMLQAIGAP